MNQSWSIPDFTILMDVLIFVNLNRIFDSSPIQRKIMYFFFSFLWGVYSDLVINMWGYVVLTGFSLAQEHIYQNNCDSIISYKSSTIVV